MSWRAQQQIFNTPQQPICANSNKPIAKDVSYKNKKQDATGR
jgi:hypothetical protein